MPVIFSPVRRFADGDFIDAASFSETPAPQPVKSTISAYFSPDGGIRDKIIARINLR